MTRRGIRVGILSNEFFHPRHGGVGGFGWAARRAIDSFQCETSSVEDVVLLAGAHFGETDEVDELHGCRVLRLTNGSRLRNAIEHLRTRIDVVLSIDYRPSYLKWMMALPFTPVIVWVRDPRTHEDWRRIRTLRIPGKDDMRPGGINHIDTHSLKRFIHKSRFLRRPIVLANKMEYLGEKIPATYGLEPSKRLLCNPDVVDYGRVVIEKSARPRAVFLGRTDPIKRPWLFVELARRLPNIEFVVLGQNHFEDRAGWSPSDVPPNLRFIGHVDGQRKYEILSSAWVLVNTSIHEESAVSQFEALAYETPLLSCVDSDRIVERHGIFTGRFDGAGLEALPKLESGMRRLISQDEWRRELGRKGRCFVREVHNTERFIDQFTSLCQEVGVKGEYALHQAL